MSIIKINSYIFTQEENEMKEFCYVAKNMFNFKGRARRREYWISQAINYGIIYIISSIMMVLMAVSFKGVPEGNPVSIGIFIIFTIVMIIISIWSALFNLAVTVRRLHDRGMSGWILLACILGSLCCYIGAIALFVFLCLDSQEGENKYGANPKETTEPTTGGSIAAAIILPIAGLILFMIGYGILLFKMADAAGGWENLLEGSNGNSSAYEYDIDEDDNSDLGYDTDTEDEYTYEENTIEDDAVEYTEEDTEEVTEAPKNDTAGSDAPENVVSGTSLTSPAKIGDWLESKEYSTVDSAYHTIYYRITDIVAGDEVAEVIAKHNEDGLTVFGDLEKEELEYRLIKYEVYIPTDFPAEEWGLYDAKVDFSITDEDEGGVNYNNMSYIGLGTYDITRYFEDNEVMPGDTFTEGRAIMVMIKDFDDYLLEARTYDGENTTSEYIQGK